MQVGHRWASEIRGRQAGIGRYTGRFFADHEPASDRSFGHHFSDNCADPGTWVKTRRFQKLVRTPSAKDKKCLRIRYPVGRSGIKSKWGEQHKSLRHHSNSARTKALTADTEHKKTQVWSTRVQREDADSEQRASHTATGELPAPRLRSTGGLTARHSHRGHRHQVLLTTYPTFFRLLWNIYFIIPLARNGVVLLFFGKESTINIASFPSFSLNLYRESNVVHDRSVRISIWRLILKSEMGPRSRLIAHVPCRHLVVNCPLLGVPKHRVPCRFCTYKFEHLQTSLPFITEFTLSIFVQRPQFKAIKTFPYWQMFFYTKYQYTYSAREFNLA